MEFRRLAAMVLVALVLPFSFTSCLLLEEALLTPSEAETTMAVKDSAPMGPKVDWLLTAEGLDASVGQRVTLKFPPNGQVSSVWGTGIYTNDSSIGSAAVHMGLLTFEKGGEVTIEIRNGQASYEGSARNGVSSSSYGEWGGSFVFINQDGQEVLIAPAQSTATADPIASAPSAKEPASTTPVVSDADWNTSAEQWEFKPGVRYSVTLPPGGSAGSVWGTDIYTNDSCIGTAAVHAGLITFNAGGQVTIELVEGKPSYEGSTRNGVTSSSYGDWGGSYVFIDAKGNVVLPKQSALPEIAVPGVEWGTNATQWQVKPGMLYTLVLPPGGSAGTVWGTDIYTNDSCIGTAAVHAGLITFNAGGKVTLELVEGKPSYEGSTRNGVTSSSYGNWGGSYRFVK
ncbi:MAG: LCCL domain-containing protein [Sphaerochaeta sp.]